MARRVKLQATSMPASKKKSRCAAPRSLVIQPFWRPLYSSRMLDGPLTELGPCACARAAAVNRTKPITATWLNTMQNRRPPPLPVMSSPQYFLSSVLIGSFPLLVEDIAALHTRPSVVSLQSADLESFTCRHS